jgi:uncharacterized protein (TIGR02996 family)
MSEEAAFLAGIQANPDDDTLRLVYADWLDERQDPRAEYLRLDTNISDHMREQRTVAREALDRHADLQDAIDLNWLVLVTRVRYPEHHIRPWVWQLLESANRSLHSLSQLLEALPKERLETFAREIYDAKSYVNPCYWEECYPHLLGGCSEDHGDDFAAWVVMEGRDFYEQVRARPDKINQHLQTYDEVVRNRYRKRKSRSVPKEWTDADRSEYRGYQRVDYLARRIYEVRFGDGLML